MPLLPPAEQEITLTAFVNICIHLPDFVISIYSIIVLNSHVTFFVRKIQGVSHLHDFMGVTGP